MMGGNGYHPPDNNRNKADMAEWGAALSADRLGEGTIPDMGMVFASSKQRCRDVELLQLMLLSLLFSLDDLLPGCQEMKTTDPSSLPHFFLFEFLHLKLGPHATTNFKRFSIQFLSIVLQKRLL